MVLCSIDEEHPATFGDEKDEVGTSRVDTRNVDEGNQYTINSENQVSEENATYHHCHLPLDAL